MLVISIPGTRGHGNPVKDNISVPMKKVTLEVEPRQFDGNLGETVNNLTKDYIKGATILYHITGRTPDLQCIFGNHLKPGINWTCRSGLQIKY